MSDQAIFLAPTLLPVLNHASWLTIRIATKVLRGFNGAVMAYGQTGTGKTHTMFGSMHQPRAREPLTTVQEGPNSKQGRRTVE